MVFAGLFSFSGFATARAQGVPCRKVTISRKAGIMIPLTSKKFGWFRKSIINLMMKTNYDLKNRPNAMKLPVNPRKRLKIRIKPTCVPLRNTIFMTGRPKMFSVRKEKSK